MFHTGMPKIFFCLSFILGCSSHPKQTASNDLQQKYLAQQKTIEALKEENSFLKARRVNQVSLRGHGSSDLVVSDKYGSASNPSSKQLIEAVREYERKNWFKVIKLTEAIIKYSPASPTKSEAYLIRGQSFRRMGLTDQAKQCFEQSLLSNPDTNVKKMAQSELRNLDFLRSKQKASRE